MTPKEIVKNYNKLEDELFTKALKYLKVTLLEQGWGKVVENMYVEDDVLTVVLRDSLWVTDGSREFYTIKFDGELEVVV